jgi:hypothetical protein
MPLWGRSEKRVPMAIEACLLGASDPRASEQVVTENVSARGARVITKQRWQSGQQLRIAVLTGELHRDARIVYCHSGPSNSFYLGLEFRECATGWWGDVVA